MTAGFFAKVSVAMAVVLAASHHAHTQGSMGGSIGVQEKSVSGDREAPRAAPPPPSRQRSAPEAKRPAPRKGGGGGGGGGGGNYDGVWHVTNIGCGGGSGPVTISGGRIVAGGVSGSVSGNGSVRTASSNSVGWGRISGNRASGGFRTNDGCTGRWTASR